MNSDFNGSVLRIAVNMIQNVQSVNITAILKGAIDEFLQEEEEDFLLARRLLPLSCLLEDLGSADDAISMYRLVIKHSLAAMTKLRQFGKDEKSDGSVQSLKWRAQIESIASVHLSALGHLSDLLMRKKQDFASAESLYSVDLEQYSSLLDFRPSYCINGFLQIGRFFLSRSLLSRDSPAEVSLRKAIDMSRKPEEGRGYGTTSNAMIDLARVYKAQGRFDEAYTLLQNALSIIELNIGPQNLSAVQVRCEIADLYRQRGLFKGQASAV